MKTISKIKLANLTTWIMVITISIIAIWFIGFLIANTFDLNVFTQRTSDFMFGFIGFSAVLIICSAILNISLNIGLIADKKMQENFKAESKTIGNKIYIGTILGIFVLIVFMFLGDYLTRKNEENKLITAADYIIETYSESINKIAPSLKDTAQVGEIPKILSFLSNQKSEFQSVMLITSGKFDGQLTFLQISSWDSEESLKEPLYDNSYYQCEEYDCEYIRDFFTGKTSKSLFWTEKNDYKLYYPFVKKDTKYILLFTQYESSGKLGSS